MITSSSSIQTELNDNSLQQPQDESLSFQLLSAY